MNLIDAALTGFGYSARDISGIPTSLKSELLTSELTNNGSIITIGHEAAAAIATNIILHAVHNENLVSSAKKCLTLTLQTEELDWTKIPDLFSLLSNKMPLKTAAEKTKIIKN